MGEQSRGKGLPQQETDSPKGQTQERKMERLVLLLYSLYLVSAIIFAYRSDWDASITSLIFMFFILCWMLFLGNYRTYHFRTAAALVMVGLSLIIYSIMSGDVTSALFPLTTIAVVSGLCGFSDITKIPFFVWVVIILYHGPFKHNYALHTMEDLYHYANPIINTLLAIFAVNFWVTQREKSGARLLEVIKRQKKAEKSKDEFLANLSHEIRTPINMISGMSEILMQEKDPEKMREEIYAIQTGSRNLMNVVRDILDFSELQSGKMEIVEDAYEVTSVVNDIVRMTVAQNAEKELEIIVDIDAKMPRLLLGDEKRIRRLVMNVVDNAIKFTNEGGVYIQIGTRRESYGVNLVITIRDTGSGMSQKTVERLFTVYNQADSSSSRQEGGIGLGLMISQTIVHQMGGVITIKSKKGEGTTMGIVIPQKIIDERPIVEIDREKIRRVFVFLDMEHYDSRIRDAYAELISHICSEIPGKATVCRNLQELKRRTKKERFDLAFTGYQEYMREKEYFDELAKSSGLAVAVDPGEESRVDNPNIYVIQRPLTILALASILRSVCCRREHIAEKKNERFIAPDARLLVVDDNIMNIKVVEGLLKKYQVQVVRALSGIEAIEKVASRDYDFIFMDHMMPEMDGVETMKRIRTLGGSYCTMVPIIALTANAVAGAREQLLAEGFNDFVEKPVERSILEKTLLENIPQNKIIYISDEEALEDKSRKKEADGTAYVDKKEQQAFFVKGLDMETGKMYCGGEEPYRLILKDYARKGDKNWSELVRLYEQKDWRNYTIAVHAVKSCMLSIGAKELSGKAKALENAGKAGEFAYIEKKHDEMLADFKQVIADITAGVGAVPDAGQKKEEAALLPEISDEEFDRLAIAFEDAMYDLDGSAMKDILTQFEQYSYCNRNLKDHLQAVESKIEMADYMSAVEVVLHLKDRLKRAE